MRASPGVLAFISLILLAFPANSTVLMYISVKELTTRSTDVVQGKVILQQVVQQGDDIYTDSHVLVSEAIKGKATRGKVIVLRQIGGETATRGLRVAGVARFVVGEQVLVFARSINRTHHLPVGMYLGKYSITRDKQGRSWASRATGGAAIARFDSGARLTIRPHNVRGYWDLLPHAKLVSHIRAQLKGGGAR